MRDLMTALCLLTVASLGGCTTPTSGILVMAHGKPGSAWNQHVEAVVAPLKDEHPVEIAFGMARTSTIREAVERLQNQGVRRIAVVRMFISDDSFLEQTEYILGLRDHVPHAHHPSMETPEPIPTAATFVLSCKGVGASPLVDQILIDRVQALSTNPSEESVLILAHGPGNDAENERWLANMRLRAQRIHELGAFRHVQCETLREDWPERRAEAERRIRAYVESGNKDGGRVIVVPFRIAGFGPYRDVLHGLSYVADERGFCPHPNMTRWIEQSAEECFATP